MGEAQKKHYAKVKANNLCRRCGKPLDREGAYCTKCLPIQNKMVKEDRDWFVSKRICPRCRKERLYGNEKTCPECRAKMTERVTKDRNADRQKYNNYMSNYSRNVYKERSEKGICTRCGKRKADNGMKTCGVCRQKHRETVKVNYKYKNPHRGEEGYCYRCGKPIEDKKYKLCNACVEQNRINAKNTSTENHYWRKLDKLIYERKIVQ